MQSKVLKWYNRTYHNACYCAIYTLRILDNGLRNLIGKMLTENALDNLCLLNYLKILEGKIFNLDICTYVYS